jgi:hypothetical protein
VVLFGEVVKTLGGRAWLEEVTGGMPLEVIPGPQSLPVSPSPSCLPESELPLPLYAPITMMLCLTMGPESTTPEL